jgi:phosphomevalonate kinase
MSRVIASAPGKALLCGEYAVLHGAPAVVAAVDRRVRAWIGGPGEGTAASAFTRAALMAAAGQSGVEIAADCVGVNSDELYAGDRKLGLGSSAAVTVAVCAGALAATGADLADGPTRDTLFQLADRAHARAQGARGSGADVAASVHGGVLRFQRTRGLDEAPEITPLLMPSDLAVVFIDAGAAASTVSLVGRVRDLAAVDKGRHDTLIARLVECATTFADALRRADVPAAISAADDYGRRLGELGQAAAAPIITPLLARLADVCRGLGAAAKPSGAGGGDLAVVFSPQSRTDAVLTALEREGFSRLDVGLDGAVTPPGAPAAAPRACGVRLETP